MKMHEISEWVTALDRAHGLVQAVQDAASPEAASTASRAALASLAELHERMLRAEIRAVVSRSAE